MATISLTTYASTQRADSANVASSLVMRDTDKSINVGAANVDSLNNAGTDTGSVSGTTTAAAGTTTSDATILPAGTARTYITSGADGTKGVKIHTSDKVTGRRLLIVNTAAAVLKIYGPTGAVINAGAADAAFSTTSGKSAIVECTDATGNTWGAVG